MTLSVLGAVYSGWCRMVRNLFKWSPDVLEYMSVASIVKLVDESIEDNNDGKIKMDDLE